MRKAVKIIAIVVVSLVVLVAAAVFIGTRSWFIKSQVLPRASAAVGLPITATDINLSPFSQVEIVGLQVGAAPTPLLKAGTIRVRYHLFSILRGDLKIDEVLVDQAQVQVIQEADGKSNLPPAPAAKPAEKAPKSASPPVALRPDIHDVQIRNLTILYDKKGGPNPIHAELRNIALALPELRSGAPIKLSLTSDLKLTQGAQVNLDRGRLSAELTSALDSALLPTDVKLDARVGDLSGTIQAIPLANRELTVHANLVREGNALTIGAFQITERAGGKAELTVAVTGNLQLPEPFAADLDIRVDPISPEILNLAGGLAGGLQFGRTSGTYIGHVTLRNGSEVAAKGSLRLTEITVASPQLPALAPVDFALDHDVTATLATTTVRVAVLSAQLGEKGNAPFFRLQLTQPMTLNWGEAGKGNAVTPTAKLLLELNNLNLMLAAPFLPPKGPAGLLGGRLNGDLTAEIMELGQRVEFSGNVKGTGIAVRVNGQNLPPLDYSQEIQGTLTHLRDLATTLSARLRIAGAEALSYRLDAKTDLKTQEGTFDIAVATANQKLFALLPPDLSKTTGLIDAFDLQTHIKVAAGDRWQRLGLSGDLTVPHLQAHLPDGTRLPAVQQALRFDAVVDLPKSEIRLAELQADVKQENRAVVTLQLTKPLAFSWAKNKAAGEDLTPAELRLTLDRLSLALANPFLVAAKTTFNQGTLSGNLNAVVGKLGNDISVNGAFSADGLELTTAQGAIKGLSLKETLDIRLQNLNLLDIRKQELEIRADERTALRVETTGSVDLTTLTGQAELLVPVLNERLFSLVPSETAKSLPTIERLTLTAKLAARFQDKGKTASVTGTIDMPLATVVTDAARIPPNLQATAELDVAQIGGSEIRIRKFSLLATQAQKPVAHIAIDGTYYLPPAKQESTLTVRSDGADLKWLASLAPQPPAAAASPAPSASRPAGPIGLTSEPPAVDMKGLWLTTKLDLRNLTYGDIAVTELRGTTKVKDNVVDVQPLDVVINGATFHLESHADLNKPGYKYQAVAKLENLPFTPFIATFAPAMREQLQGRLKSLEFRGKGEGLTPANLSRNFDGSLNLVADGIKLQKLPALVEIAAKTGVPELETIVFDTATVKMKSQDGKMNLTDVAMTGKELRLELAGTSDFDVRLNLTARIGVAGNLESRLRLKLAPLFEAKQGDYSYLRTPVPLQGYPGQLQGKQILMSMIQKSVSQAATNAIGSVIKAQMEGKKLDSKALLNSFLNPGAAAAATSATTTSTGTTATTGTAVTPPATAAAPAKASSNDLLFNLLQGAAAQPAAAQPTTTTTVPAAPTSRTSDDATWQPAATPAAKTPPEAPQTQKQKRNDAMRELGTGLLNNFLQGK